MEYQRRHQRHRRRAQRQAQCARHDAASGEPCGGGDRPDRRPRPFCRAGRGVRPGRLTADRDFPSRQVSAAIAADCAAKRLCAGHSTQCIVVQYCCRCSGGGLSVRRKNFPIIAVAALALAGCASLGQSVGAARDPTPERPGTRITVRNPNNAKWMAVQAPGQSKGTPMWICRPLACASGRAAVAAQNGPSPTRYPDRKALEKAASLLAVQTRAQDMMMEAASEGDERVTALSSRVADVRGYPAIIAESK